MQTYDLCVAWNWEWDAGFIELLRQACARHHLSLLEATPENLTHLLLDLERAETSFYAFLDRASDSDPHFLPLVHWAQNHAHLRINPYEHASLTWNKSAMHYALIDAGLHTPYTIHLPPYQQEPMLPTLDLCPLGDQFTIKPAHGGGGEGVIMEAKSMEEVMHARQVSPSDQYLLQAHIVAQDLDSRPAWFRVICCTGEVFPHWWDPQTHFYHPVSVHEKNRFHLDPLWGIPLSLAAICNLELFSTEIALVSSGAFIVVDYVNDPIDLRLQSQAIDGVPDEVILHIADRLVEYVRNHLIQSST